MTGSIKNLFFTKLITKHYKSFSTKLILFADVIIQSIGIVPKKDFGPITISPSGSISICKNTDITLTANGGAGITWQWLKNGDEIVGATNQTYTTSKGGNYKVKESSGD